MSRESVCSYCHLEFKSGNSLSVLSGSSFMTKIIKCVEG